MWPSKRRGGKSESHESRRDDIFYFHSSAADDFPRNMYDEKASLEASNYHDYLIDPHCRIAEHM